MKFIDEGYLISILLVCLCVLASLDIWRQYALKSNAKWEKYYRAAISRTYDFWKTGYRLEDLEVKLEQQELHLNKYLHHVDATIAPRFVLNKNTLRHNVHNIEYVRDARISLHNMQWNDTRVFQIRCEANGPQLRFGVNDFRADPRDECQIFTSVKAQHTPGPQSLFHIISVNDGAFALRSIGSGMFVKAVAPPDDNKGAPWKLVIGGAVIGSAETFRLSDEGYLHSALMGGFFTCGAARMVSGYPGKYGSWSKFVLEPVKDDIVHHAYLQVDLSRQLVKMQKNYFDEVKINYQRNKMLAATAVSNQKSSENTPAPTSSITKICLAVPMTSKGTDMKSVVDSPFWNNLFDSFMKSIDWRSNTKYVFKFYIGFDKGDELYDTGDAWSEFREEFKHRATYRMVEQMMDEESITKVLESQLSIKIMHFEHLEGAPSQVVSQLVLTAYSEGFDYFYQVNDDTVIESPNWMGKLISSLRNNPLHPNLGVTGPTDANNEKIFTHSFTHRTHIDIFGHLFPTSFKNWWSDDWISTVYGDMSTFRTEDVRIMHNVKGQKTGDLNRYKVDQAAQFELDYELRQGHVQIDRWLKSKGLPRLALPVICGYIPAVKFLADTVMDASLKNEMEHRVTV